MPKTALKNKGKIKCPMCSLIFVPEFFHLEKLKYEFNLPNNEANPHSHKSNNSVIKPSKVISRSWVTSCPDCSYLIRFAAEMGKKEVVENSKTLLHLKEFKEKGQSFKYKFYTLEKPFKDTNYFRKELIEKTQNKIKSTLEDINLSQWGSLYKAWQQGGDIDSFKFLIRFFTYFEKYVENYVDEIENLEITDKVDAIKLSDNLKNLMLKIYAIRNIMINDNYDLIEDDELLVNGTFIKFIFELILKNLKTLKLSAIKFDKNYSTVDKHSFYTDLRIYLYNYLFDMLGINDFENEFFVPLISALKLPVE